MEKKKVIKKISFEKGNQRAQAAAILMTTAMPPMVGTGNVCSLRRLGTSYSLKRLMTIISKGINTIEITKAETKERMPVL